MSGNSQGSHNDFYRLRAELGLRQREVAAKVGCSIAIVSLCERNLLPYPSQRERWNARIVAALAALAQEEVGA